MSIQTELSYRRTAVEGASTIGLTIALYDTLAGDLKRAAEALGAGDIEARCRQINHALTIIGYLESWIDRANGEDLANSLKTLYSYLRVKMMEGQVSKSAEIFEELMRLVLEVRGSWQQVDQPAAAVAGDAGGRGERQTGFPGCAPERVGSSSWSA